VIDSEILAQIAIFLAKPISKLLLVSQKNLQDDQKMLYIKEINPKLRLLINVPLSQYKTVKAVIFHKKTEISVHVHSSRVECEGIKGAKTSRDLLFLHFLRGEFYVGREHVRISHMIDSYKSLHE
jgi:hypothetical protein